MANYKILKLNAAKILEFGFSIPEKKDEYIISYRIDLDKKAIYGSVVEAQLLMDNCALFDQFNSLLGTEKPEVESLLQELVIVDFTDIYKSKSDIPENYVKNLIENGFIMQYINKEIHMLPFDKSGNMSRKCRLSFINADYIDKMNERLNLGIDFNMIPVKLSKFYAYRGLYLSTAKRIEDELLKITPESLIIIDDLMNKEYPNYQPTVKFETGIPDDEDSSKISFTTVDIKQEKITVPFDGQGIISPMYADLINNVLGNNKVNSYQIRLPFSKGMLHRVDFHAFLQEFDPYYATADAYDITDAFGKKRDLKLANIVMTKSMFKCYEWVKKQCEENKIADPMKFYCDALEKYGHALYISSTDIPYGNSKLTHTSYQLLNTLQLSENQFESLIDKHLDYVHNPIEYIRMTQGNLCEENEEDGAFSELLNWQKAVLINPSFAKLSYIREQLRNTQVALMTKLALGKLVVKGQTRYMTRDLPAMLVNLISNNEIKKKLKDYKIYSYRFYLPQGNTGKNDIGLNYNTHCGFFRSPHLSRNEQGILVPLVKNEKCSENYNNDCASIDKYFGHLTGVIMFGNESLEPMALGGADFDGDLVGMIMDEDIVKAIRDAVYVRDKHRLLGNQRREDMPYIKIPTIPSADETVPKTIPYLQIKNTFSNKIGLISNAAITIGQSEYGNKKSEKLDVKCAHCTILTGLEIDAAKNGVHPDLSRITTDKSLTTCGYLKFKKEFEEYKKHKEYHFNRLWHEVKDDDVHVLGSKDIARTITYEEEAGTYINKLPVKFMENLNPKLDIPVEKDCPMFNFPVIETDQDKETVFKEHCNMIFDSYKYYKNLLFVVQNAIKVVEKDKNRDEKNLEKLLEKQYDPEHVDNIMNEAIPYLLEKLANKINSHAKYKDFTDKMNRKNWHLLSVDGKKDFLCEELGLDSVDDDRWMIILQPYNHNYKALWYLVRKIKRGLRPEYGELKCMYNQKHQNNNQLYPYIVSRADSLLRNCLENKCEGASSRLYDMCLTSLKDMIEVSTIAASRKIEILFELTKKSNSRFFWECFEWEEMEGYVCKEL